MIASGLREPAGVAFRDRALYVSAISRILRFDDIERRLADPPAPGRRQRPPSRRRASWPQVHRVRSGRQALRAVGVPCNVCELDPDRYGIIARMNPDGSGLEVFARGLRNSVGFDWDPRTKELWFTDNGRDMTSATTCRPDTLNHAPRAGLRFGFPVLPRRDDPGPGVRPQASVLASSSRPRRSSVRTSPRSACASTRGTSFPAAYRNRVFIAEHGSWNRSAKIGYRVTMVTLDGDKAVRYEPFAEGWLQGAERMGTPGGRAGRAGWLAAGVRRRRRRDLPDPLQGAVESAERVSCARRGDRHSRDALRYPSAGSPKLRRPTKRGRHARSHRQFAARASSPSQPSCSGAPALPALAADLTVGLGTDVTAIDPHYHNLTPNNNVAAHLFGYLVAAQREVAARAGARHRVEDGRPADVGVQAAQRRQVPRRQRVHRGRRRRVDRARADGAEQPVAVHRVHEADQGNDRRRSVHDPLQDGGAVSADAVGHDAGRDHLEERGEGVDRRFQQRQGGDRHRPVQARPLREERSHRARAQRRLLGRQDAVGQGDAAPPAAGRRARRGAAVGRRPGDRERADLRRRAARARTSGSPSIRTVADRLIYLHMDSDRDVSPFVTDKAGQAAREESAQGSARAQGDLEGDQPAGDRREGDGGRGDSRRASSSPISCSARRRT